MIGAMVRVGGVAVDARRAAHEIAAHEIDRAAASAWIAENLLAARGRTVPRRGPPAPVSLVHVHARGLDDLLAAVVTRPAVIDATTLPVRWRLLLRAAGMPLLAGSRADALAAGTSVAVRT